MTAYTTRHVAELLGITVDQVRAYARTGVLEPERGARREYRFSFRDLVVFRACRGLAVARIPHARIRRALRQLRRQLPASQPLTEVRLAVNGREIVASDDGAAWNPESGQFHLGLADPARVPASPGWVAELAGSAGGAGLVRADAWFELGCEREPVDPASAREAYQRALELDPAHCDAHVNLGRMLHAERQHAEAEAHYRVALAVRPDHPTAAFNLGIVLEDLGRFPEAVRAYEQAVMADPELADAYFNLSRLYQATGNRTAAFWSLSQYRRLGPNRR